MHVFFLNDIIIFPYGSCSWKSFWGMFWAACRPELLWPTMTNCWLCSLLCCVCCFCTSPSSCAPLSLPFGIPPSQTPSASHTPKRSGKKSWLSSKYASLAIYVKCHMTRVQDCTLLIVLLFFYFSIFLYVSLHCADILECGILLSLNFFANPSFSILSNYFISCIVMKGFININL